MSRWTCLLRRSYRNGIRLGVTNGFLTRSEFNLSRWLPVRAAGLRN
jgi:hypothetical protein